MDNKEQQFTDVCPSCGVDYAWHPDYPKWCPECEWNLKPESSPVKKTLLNRFFQRKGKREGEKMLNRFKAFSEAELKPKTTLSTILAIFVALFIHSLSLFIAGLGFYVLFTWWPMFMFMVLGALLLAGAWALRPRFNPLPVEYLKPQDFPALFSLVNRVSTAVGGKMVDYIIVDERFNAAFAQVGARGKTVMFIGLPLWTIMSMQERIAIIGHEASHGVNGDPARGFVTGSAVSTLSKWTSFLRPNMEQADDLIMVFVYGVLWVVSVPVEWLAASLELLNLRASQKAEYLADFLATKASGTKAMVSGLIKSNYYHLMERVLVCDIVSDTQPGTDFYDCLRAKLASLPEHEKERIRRITVLEDASLDDTHPPTAFRMDFLESRAIDDPIVTLNDAEITLLEEEMKTLEGPTGRRIILDQMHNF